MYEASKRLEAIPLAGRKVSSRTETMGLVLKYYRWRYQMRQEPCFAVAGKDEYLSEFSRKESGCVYIPADTLSRHTAFRLVVGRKGKRRTYFFTNARIEGDRWLADLERMTDERTQPKEMPIINYWKQQEAA